MVGDRPAPTSIRWARKCYDTSRLEGESRKVLPLVGVRCGLGASDASTRASAEEAGRIGSDPAEHYESTRTPALVVKLACPGRNASLYGALVPGFVSLAYARYDV